MISIISLVIGILVVVILIGGVGTMTKNFSLRSVYLYLVCIITLIIFIFGTIFTIQRVVDITVGTGYYYMTLEDYQSRYNVFGPDGKQIESQIDQEEIQRRYENYLKDEKERGRANHIRQLASNASAMVVGGAFWIYHWKKIKDED